MIQQYHTGKTDDLNYRSIRRTAHNCDAELASVISTLATEPKLDTTYKTLAFDFLCLSHTFLSYIAALGAHREKLNQPEILALLDQAMDDIQGALLKDEAPDLNLQQLRTQIKTDDPVALLVLQQLSLMFNIIDQLRTLKQNLNYIDADETTFGSI